MRIVLKVDEHGNVLEKFYSVKDAAEKLGLSSGSVVQRIRRKSLLNGIWQQTTQLTSMKKLTVRSIWWISIRQLLTQRKLQIFNIVLNGSLIQVEIYKTQGVGEGLNLERIK